MDYELVEEEIKDRIKEKIPTLDVVVQPENPKEMEQPVVNCRVTVAYSGSDFESVAANKASVFDPAIVRENEMVMVDIIIQSMKLRGPTGIYKFIKDVKKAVVGYEPTDCGKITIQKQSFIAYEKEKALYSYTLKIATTSLLVEDIEPEGGPALDTVDFNIEVE